MKKHMLVTALAAISLSTAIPAAHADGNWALKPGAQYIDYDNKRQFDDEELGGSFGVERMWDRWGTEFQIFANDADPKNVSGDVDLLGAALNQYLYLMPNRAFNPYLVAGVGHADFDGRAYDEKETQGSLGVGFRSRITDAIDVWFDVKGVHGFDDSTTDTVAGLGLAFNVGGEPPRRPAPAPAAPVAPADSDGDGVPNSSDRCPRTSSKASVDQHGCAVDSDRDGVADYLDQCPGTASGVKVDAQGCKHKQTRVEEVRLNVHFANNSAELTSGVDSEVAPLAAFMKKHGDLNVILEGHTDSSGPADYNQKLSERRANAVAAMLIKRYGIASARVSAKGFGETKPVANNNTAAGRAENRRVIAALTKAVTE